MNISKNKGITLIEIIVVIFIIGIMIGTLSLTLGDNQSERLQKKSNQLNALIELAKEQAIFNSEELGLVFTKNSYSFYKMVVNNENQILWESVKDDRLLRERTLPEGLEYSLYLEGIKVDFNENKNDSPQVFILSDGSVTPFRIDIGDNIKHKSSLTYAENGEYEFNAVN